MATTTICSTTPSGTFLNVNVFIDSYTLSHACNQKKIITTSLTTSQEYQLQINIQDQNPYLKYIPLSRRLRVEGERLRKLRVIRVFARNRLPAVLRSFSGQFLRKLETIVQRLDTLRLIILCAPGDCGEAPRSEGARLLCGSGIGMWYHEGEFPFGGDWFRRVG